MREYQIAKKWYGWVDEGTPVLVVLDCMPLSHLGCNHYGCSVYVGP